MNKDETTLLEVCVSLVSVRYLGWFMAIKVFFISFTALYILGGQSSET